MVDYEVKRMMESPSYKTVRGTVLGVYAVDSVREIEIKRDRFYTGTEKRPPTLAVLVKTKVGDKIGVIEGGPKDIACLGALCEAAIREESAITFVGHATEHDWQDSYEISLMRIKGIEVSLRYGHGLSTKKVGPEHKIGKVEE